MRALYRVAIGLVGIALVALACNTPTIPIPPLHAPTYSSPAMDQWVASGTGAPSSAEVFAINRASGAGVVSRADAGGAYMTSRFAGRTGDTVELFYRTTTGEVSESVCSMLAVGTPPPVPCP